MANWAYERVYWVICDKCKQFSCPCVRSICLASESQKPFGDAESKIFIEKSLNKIDCATIDCATTDETPYWEIIEFNNIPQRFMGESILNRESMNIPQQLLSDKKEKKTTRFSDLDVV